MSWVQLIVLILQLANRWLKDQEQKGLIKIGEDRQIAKELAEMLSRNKTFKEIEDEFDRLPMARIVDYLSREGDFRD